MFLYIQNRLVFFIMVIIIIVIISEHIGTTVRCVAYYFLYYCRTHDARRANVLNYYISGKTKLFYYIIL